MENIITKIENILGEAAAGIKHESQVLLNALKDLYHHHKQVESGVVTAPHTAPAEAVTAPVPSVPVVETKLEETLSGSSTKE